MEDHPRPCGEQPPDPINRAGFSGSPPPLRGTAYLIYHRPAFPRITPAPAGNRYPGRQNPGITGDHPRPCGEQLYSVSAVDMVTGSPPPLRGTAAFKPIPGREGGITPAPAGNRCKSRSQRKPRQDHPRPCGEQIYETLSVLKR